MIICPPSLSVKYIPQMEIDFLSIFFGKMTVNKCKEARKFWMEEGSNPGAY